MSKAQPLRHVGLSLGNLEAFVDGLGEFSRQLVQTLADRAGELREQHGLVLHLHCTQPLQGVFGPAVQYLPVQRSQEWRHPGPQRMDLWHRLNQLNRYGPPQGAGLQLVTVHDLNYLYEKRGFSRWRHQWRLKQQLRRSDALVTITEHVAGDVRRALGWHGPLQVIHNGVRDFSTLPPEPVPALQALAAPGGPGYLFHISRMTPSKNVEALLRMLAAWPGRHLVLAGPSEPRNTELQAQAQALGLTERVHLVTRPSDAQKAWLYAHCTAFLFPSLTEGFGLPPIEALHFGTPVCLSDRSSLPEVGGAAAHYWRSFEPAAMRQVVEQALQQHGPAQAAAARVQAQRFSWTRAAEAYLQAYLSLLQAGAGDRALLAGLAGPWTAQNR
jgi:glycosyltransferase involved in cell wall biosynthesis